MDVFHALNRGVDKRVIFQDNQDYARFVHDLFQFNCTTPANNTTRTSQNDTVSRSVIQGEKLVDIHGWCLMSNHYHLLLSERIEGGLSLFLRKLNVGYAKYFNERYKRSGTLFQGRTKKILIDNDAYFLHILNYIHLNPLDTLSSALLWRERKVTDAPEALRTLQSYRWSSYLDYAGVKNFPSILTTSLFNATFDGNYMKAFEKYLVDLNMSEIRHLTHE